MRYTKTSMRFAAAALSALIGMSVGFGPAGSVYAADYQRVNGSYQLKDGTNIKEVIARGIDVSRWQGNIDWTSVAADDVSFVMLGTRSKGVTDPNFHANVQGASAAGLNVGAYIYSLATTTDMARAEADFVLDLVKDYPISFPIAFDAEDSSTLGTLPPYEVSQIINAFCDRIREAGYYPIVYANDYWLANKIDLSQMKNDIWVARYEAKHTFENPVMWQVTSTGQIQGINTNVDINFLYQDFNQTIPGNLWRTIGGRTYYYQNYSMQRDTWINDGTGWFFMNNEGQPSTGWFDKDGMRYYLDDTTGRMFTGWKNLSDKWYFFNAGGSMNTGWLLDNGAKYYLNSDGTMATGWIDLNGQYYYMDESSGHMKTGWMDLNGKRYYLQDSGVMSTGWLDLNNTRYYLNNDGTLVTGWHMDGLSKYYMAEDGSMATGWKQLDNTWYYFNPNGIMSTGWISPDGNWYYLSNEGKMQSGWLEDGGAKYYLSNSSGKMTVGWREIDGSWYYFGGSGSMETGMITVGDKQYYMNPSDGKMKASETFLLDGVSYTADASGVCAITPTETPTETPAETPAGTPEETAAETQPGDSPGTGTPGSPSESSSSAPGSETAPQKEIGPGIH